MLTMLYDLCQPVARVKRPDCSYHSNHTGLNDPTFLSILIRWSLEGVMIYTTSRHTLELGRGWETCAKYCILEPLNE